MTKEKPLMVEGMRNVPFTITQRPNYVFSDPSGEVGKFWHEDGLWHFEGDCDAAAQLFVDSVLIQVNR
jgi:hypothetical protein